MVIVIFEFEPEPQFEDRYFELASRLREEVEQIDGFLSVERFESLNHPKRFVSISTWRDMDAVKSWHSQADHMASQTEARASGLFKDFRIRVADVVRDYGL